MKRGAWAFLVLVSACTNKTQEPIPKVQPQPLEPLERVVFDAGDSRDALFDIVPLQPVGPAVPTGLHELHLGGESLPDVPATGGVLLVSDEDSYLVQVAPLLAQLSDGHREVWLKHPDAPVAFKVELRDAAQFRAWIDEPVPGKFRVIHRADGFELQTNLGKLPGGDPNGPTVPVRGGKMDLTTLQKGFERIQGKFKAAPDVCFVPSFGMELRTIARAMAVNYVRPDSAFFEHLCLVYPRP